jgi:hypothetical protein
VKKSYQQGSLAQVKRKQGRVWRFRWRENGVPKARIVGWLRELPTEADARKKLHTLSLNINRRARPNQPRTFAELISTRKLSWRQTTSNTRPTAPNRRTRSI